MDQMWQLQKLTATSPYIEVGKARFKFQEPKRKHATRPPIQQILHKTGIQANLSEICPNAKTPSTASRDRFQLTDIEDGTCYAVPLCSVGLTLI